MSRQGQLAYSFAKRHGVLLVKQGESQEQGLLLREDVKLSTLMEVRRIFGSLIVHESLPSADFNQRLAMSYQGDGGESQQAVDGLEDHPDLESLAESVPETEDLMEQEDDAPIIRLINALLSEAIRLSASDIHIEAFEKRLSVRMRVDGMLREIVQPRRELAPLLVSRIKVMAKLDIAEKRIPQDGRISLRLAGREVDVRVSTLPANHGERVVMRLLDKQAGRLDIGHLGLQATDHERLRELIHKPHGIMLVTGPTVEDPIEYQLEGIGQTQVNTKVDMTFARGLRAMLRQDPDVVMVGEIRDTETAEIAVQASLTGHLVLTTLHTNTAVGAVTRLKDMGIEPFLLASSLLGVVAQRLVRVLCVSCRQGFPADEGECALLGVSHQYAPVIYRPVGCDKCNFSGYRGRLGIYELVAIDDTLRRLIHSHAAEHELEAHARTMSSSIRADGIRKVLKGVTTLEEVVRATREG